MDAQGRQDPYYLDHNAATPVWPEALEEAFRIMRDLPGNPSSLHSSGRAAKKTLEEAREIVAQTLGCSVQEILFTSGGTEANNLALRGVMAHAKTLRQRLLVSAFEHPSVLETAQKFESQGLITETIPPDSRGYVTVAALEPRLAANPPALVSVLLAHNEIGTVQPIRELAALAHRHEALFHTDAVQAMGKVGPLRVGDLGIDLLSFSGHKIGGIKGAGVLYCKAGTPLQAQMTGGPQERQARAGTENVAAIAALAKACQLWQRQGEAWRANMRAARNALCAELLRLIPDLSVNGDPDLGLPNTLHLTLSGCPSDLMVAALDMHGLSVSAGSACASGSVKRSQAALAMGMSEQEARCVLRISVGPLTPVESMPGAAAILAKVAGNMRALS